MKTREELYLAGISLAGKLCAHNQLSFPKIERVLPTDRMFHLNCCGFYRPWTIRIMVEKCANRGFGGRAWSWPGYAIDRTPYGVMQHELGHHVDALKTGEVTDANVMERLFSRQIWEQSKEPALTGYLGTDTRQVTFFMEWWAEMFRLFVTNPDLLHRLRPKCHAAIIAAGIEPVQETGWELTLRNNHATERILDQASKKISAVKGEE